MHVHMRNTNCQQFWCPKRARACGCGGGGQAADEVLQQLLLGLLGVDGIELLRSVRAGHQEDAVAAARVVLQEGRRVIHLPRADSG